MDVVGALEHQTVGVVQSIYWWEQVVPTGMWGFFAVDGQSRASLEDDYDLWIGGTCAFSLREEHGSRTWADTSMVPWYSCCQEITQENS